MRFYSTLKGKQTKWRLQSFACRTRTWKKNGLRRTYNSWTLHVEFCCSCVASRGGCESGGQPSRIWGSICCAGDSWRYFTRPDLEKWGGKQWYAGIQVSSRHRSRKGIAWEWQGIGEGYDRKREVVKSAVYSNSFSRSCLGSSTGGSLYSSRKTLVAITKKDLKQKTLECTMYQLHKTRHNSLYCSTWAIATAFLQKV